MNTPPPSQGPIAGKYQLVRMIGKGGMGSVWEARHVSLGTPSAIKFIEAEYADSQDARSRFDKEAKAAATIQSKHAIQIYDHGITDDGKPYIVMELLQGEPLDKRIDRLQRISLQETAKIIQQVCRALARAHERGIIHRDLKPENIFLVRTPDDDEEVAKVLDFGIAKMSNQGPGAPGITSGTKTGAVLGTPFYMSPEQARGLRNVDHRTDVWSLGVIAFKCVTGKLPFDGESVGDLLVKICTAPVPIPSLALPGLPANFDAWFMRAMEREPDRRFSSVSELADALAFSAGIAPRSVHGTPSGPMGYTPTGQVHPTPNSFGSGGHGMAATPNPQHGTPPPGAMTNAPFTSERVAGVPSGNGKLVAGVLLGGLLVVGSVATGLYLKFGRAHPDATNGIVAPPNVSAGAAAPAVPGTAPAPTESVAVPAPTPSETAPAPTQTTAATAKKPGGGTAPKPTTTPATTASQHASPPPLPAPAPAPTPAPTPKKPNKNDPGY